MKQSATRAVILLADDDKQAAEAWSTALRMNGWDVFGHPTVTPLWRLRVRLAPICSSLTGTCLVWDGPALCRAFREDPTLATVPIILASSLTLPPDAPITHNHFLQKPVVTLTLLAAVAALTNPRPLPSDDSGIGDVS
jgi:CheY-like chemotaxis protein